MKNGLVSILTPCYNGEQYIHHLLESVLMQDYPIVEMIVIDDGSTDKSSNIIKKYIPLFNRRNYSLTYIYQENAGQSNAINNGLRLISGEYLIWPDADDYYITPTAISELVNAFENLDNTYGVVRGNIQYSDINGNMIKRCQHNQIYESLFDDALFCQNNFIWGAGAYLIKISSFNNSTNSLDIYTHKSAGQNWQLLLPILYNYKCYTIPPIIHNIVVHNDSHCRNAEPHIVINRVKIYAKTRIETLKRIKNISDKQIEEYTLQINEQMYWELYNLNINYLQLTEAKMCYSNLTSNHIKSFRDIIKIILVRIPVLFYIYAQIRKFHRKNIL